MTLDLKRRWFAYSLRTLFVVVTVFGCWLGYQLNWIRQRRAVRMREDVVFYEHAVAPNLPRFGQTAPPWQLRIFGEQAFTNLAVSPSVPPAEFKRIASLFPESTVEQSELADRPEMTNHRSP